VAFWASPMFRFTICDVLSFMLVVGLGSLRADEPGPTLKELLRQAKDLGPFDPSDSPAMAVRSEMRRHAGPRLGGNQYALQISWFRGDGRTSLRYSVTEGGFRHDYRHVYNHATQANRKKQLTEIELNSLRELLEKLPESKAEPPIERTVHTSFQAGDVWRTETYDAATLPDPFEAIMRIIGERFETRDRHKKSEHSHSRTAHAPHAE